MTGGVAAGDFDGDGRTDLLYRNLGDGTFEPQTNAAGFSTATLTNGVVSGDVDNDDDLDLYMTTTNDTRNYFYLNDSAGFFTDTGIGTVAALANVTVRQGQGASFGDYDNDGDSDIIATNGYNGGGWINDRTFLWQNDNGVFTDVSNALGITDTLQGRGLAHLDYDDDGDLDDCKQSNRPDSLPL